MSDGKTKLEKIDDWLFDRVFQPIVDRAAEFDLKARHLAATCVLCFDGMLYLRWPNVLCLLVLIWFQIGFYAILFHTQQGVYRHEYRRRMFITTYFVVVSALPPIEARIILVNLFVIGAIYFCSCEDKPPRRRRLRDMRKAFGSAWTWIAKPIPQKAHGLCRAVN